MTDPATTLVLGGARSGKSAFAETAGRRDSGLARIYLATATAGDDEMRDAHRASSRATWRRLAHHRGAAGAGRRADAGGDPGRAVLVDCLTLWLSNLMHGGARLEIESTAARGSCARPNSPSFWSRTRSALASCPETPLGRRFRDAQGRLNQIVAAAVPNVVFIAAGLPLWLKRSPLRRVDMSRVPVTVLTGFLGAGKTTLLRSLLTQADGRRIAVIVNEFGDAGFDGGLVKECAAKACAAGDIVELTNGCICCTVADDFIPTMDKLLSRERPLDAIVIETSGLALPQPLLKAFAWPDVRTRATVDGVVTVVDALALSEGRVTLDEDAVAAQRAADPSLDHDDPIEEVFEDQLACADLVVLSKSDLVCSDALADDRGSSAARCCGRACASCARTARWRRRC